MKKLLSILFIIPFLFACSDSDNETNKPEVVEPWERTYKIELTVNKGGKPFEGALIGFFQRFDGPSHDYTYKGNTVWDHINLGPIKMQPWSKGILSEKGQISFEAEYLDPNAYFDHDLIGFTIDKEDFYTYVIPEIRLDFNSDKSTIITINLD